MMIVGVFERTCEIGAQRALELGSVRICGVELLVSIASAQSLGAGDWLWT